MDRVENGEHIGIENEKGDRAVMLPADDELIRICLLYTSPSPRDVEESRMPSSA